MRSIFAVDSFDGASGPSAATQIAPGVWSVLHGEGFIPPPGAVRLAEYDPARPLIDQIAGAARAAIVSRRNARIDAMTGDARAQRRLMMGAIGILNRVGKGKPRASDAAKMAALEAAEAAIEQIEADAAAKLAAVDAALAAGDRDALAGLIE